MPDQAAENGRLVGGHLVLNFVNTVAWRSDPSRIIERIADFSALLAWAQRAGLIDNDAAMALAEDAQRDIIRAEQAARRTRELRATLYTILAEIAAGRSLPMPGLLAFQPMVVEALGHASPVPDVPLRWYLRARVPGDIPRLLAIAALQLLQSPELAALRRCQDSACGWLFLDRSRSHTRRWCSSEECGNRERVRRHAARHRSARN